MVRRRKPLSVDETVDSTRQQRQEAVDTSSHARLVAAHPADWDVVIDLAADQVILGRSPEALHAPPLQHPTVSRAHFVIEWDPHRKQHVGRDLGSRNGSQVNGQPVGSGWVPLGPGTVLRVGDVLLAYETGHTLDAHDPAEVSKSAVPGRALPMRHLRAQIARAAPDISPVLIIGETGTGKEKLAAEVHRLSGRTGDLVAINCATLGEQLIESQLFGHVKGAFTGATTDQAGLFRAADGGTLFLDEIGEMPKDLQPKLLRAIQEREIRAVGSTKTIKVDVRIVAATHQNLAEKARGGAFRQDLYARLALWQLSVPAIRNRRPDILSWLELLHGLWAEARDMAPEPLKLSADAAQALLKADWPENLRGLDRFVHEIATRRIRGAIRPEHLPEWVFAPAI